MVALDDEIAPLIAILNHKGYMTHSSCAGHVGMIGDPEKGEPSEPIYENSAFVSFVPVIGNYQFNVIKEEGERDLYEEAGFRKLFESFAKEEKVSLNFWNHDCTILVTIHTNMNILEHYQNSALVAKQAEMYIIAKRARNEMLTDEDSDPYAIKNAVNRILRKLYEYANRYLEDNGKTEYARWGMNPALYRSFDHPKYANKKFEYKDTIYCKERED